MTKMRSSFCVCFWLCCFAVGVFCSSELDESGTTTEKPVQSLESLFSHVQILENRIQELEKSCGECKLLKKEMDEMKTQARKDGGVWFLTPRLRGPPGNKGEAGPKGEIGLIGPEGPIGQDGKPGGSGEKGEKGLVGPIAQKGAMGQQGATGPKGVTGQQGATGPKGATGQQGATGPKGATGQQGATGPKGATGQQGATGPKGATGQQGATGPKGDRGISVHSSCSDAMKILPRPQIPKQWIYPHGNKNSKIIEVLCDFEVDGGGWTVIQKRSSGPSGEFNRTWSDYSTGFGSLDGNFWLGLENIRALTKNGDQELRIELEDFAGNKTYAKYSSFSISDASDFYRLTIGGFSASSTANDSMANPSLSNYVNNGMRFSTKDKDNDLWSQGSCVEYYGSGGWWFNWGSDSNLNGAYKQKEEGGYGIFWNNWKGSKSLAKSEMKIRTRK